MTTLLTILLVLNVLLLLLLFGIIYLKGKPDCNYKKLDQIEDIVVIGLFSTITITLAITGIVILV